MREVRQGRAERRSAGWKGCWSWRARSKLGRQACLRGRARRDQSGRDQSGRVLDDDKV